METDVLNRISKQIKDKNTQEALSDLRKLHRCFAVFIGLLYNRKIQLPKIWYEYYEAMAIKFRLNIYSIIELYEIEDNMPKGFIYHDLSSIYLLNRSLLETYLTFFYSYVLPKSDEEGLMNYYIFKISGLTQRQGYGIDDQVRISPELISQKNSEKVNIEKYQVELQKLKPFIDLDLKKGKKNKLVAGHYAKRFGFIELIKMSELKDVLFADMWKLYSNYAHCELLALLQINSYPDNQKRFADALYGTLANTLIVVSIMMKDFINIFKNTDAEIVDIQELDDELMILLEFWYRMGTEQK